jgi:hypothetical protein
MSAKVTEPNAGQEECKKERDSAFDTLNKDQAEYDKQLLALSAAFLGVSLAFVKDVVPLKDAVQLWEFDVALSCLLACVCLVLGTFQYSIHGHFRLVEYWEQREKRLHATDDAKTEIDGQLSELWTWLDSKADRIKIANRASGIMFVVGTVFLVVFVITNLHREAHLVPISGEPPHKQTVSLDFNKTDSSKSTAASHP